MHTKIYEKIKVFTIENYQFLIVILILLMMLFIRLPYVVYAPGGNIDLTDRIEVTDKDYPEGSFNMAYVTMYNGSIPAILLSFVIPNWDLVSNEEILPPDINMDELLTIDRLQMTASIDSATILAYEKSGNELNITKEELNVVYIAEYAVTEMMIGDIITNVDGKDIKSFEEVTTYISNLKAGDEVTIEVLRDDKEVITKSTITEVDGKNLIGISFISTYEYDETPDIEIDSKQGESGPSGGMMLTLAIYDMLLEEDLTEGKKVVGTGTIDSLGNVGEIDGVKYKLLGSKDADIFLCPEENYEEAIDTKEEFNLGMEIYMVKTIDDAIKVLSEE